MALGDSRRASGAANEAARRAIGTNNEAARRAIDARMQAERRGESVADDLNRLVRTQPARKTLRPVQPVGAIPAASSRADYKPPAASTGGGIASPVTEPDFSVREYWPSGLVSSDGLFVLPAIKKVVAADANGAEVIFEYASPVTP
jgi:hypothetical protein